LDPERRPCNCGRTGCWETMVGLAAFLRRATTDDDPVNDPGHPLAERMATLRSRADAGDEGTITALRAIASDLVSGLSILIDVLNPRAVVLGGYFAFFGEYLIGPVTAGLDARAMDAGSAALVTISRLGLLSAARGGAHLALERVFQDPTIIPARSATDTVHPASGADV
ncbi:MAG: ROK family protein, partial [Ornithinibacter sp.]